MTKLNLASIAECPSPSCTGRAMRSMISVLLPFFMMGCDGGWFGTKSCTEIGCADQFNATVIAASSELPEGTHTLTITTETGTLSCSFVIPLPTSPSGGTITPQCSPGLGVFVGANQVCTETTTDASRTLSCEPVPGQLRETITVSGTPASVHVQQSVGGTTVLDRTVTPTYKQNRPNGPGCAPLCKQASEEWTIP